jgi:hypothetical protein
MRWNSGRDPRESASTRHAYASLHRAFQRGDHAPGGGVVGDDVEQKVNVVARHVDVGDQAVDRDLVVGENFGGVSAEDWKIAEILGQRHRVLQVRTEVRVKNICILRHAIVSGLGQGFEVSMSHQAPDGQRRTSDQEIEDQAGDGLEKYQQQPPLRRVG